MKKQIKSLIVSSVAALSFGAISVGTTFALFTSNAESTVSIGSGKINISMANTDPVLYSAEYSATQTERQDERGYYYNSVQQTGSFYNGGTASYSNGVLTLTNITPGDRVTFSSSFTDTSTVSYKYRLVYELISEDTSLAKGLSTTTNISGTSSTYSGLKKYASEWKKMIVNDNNGIAGINFDIELPINKGNIYQEKSASFKLSIEAIQLNAYTEDSEVLELLEEDMVSPSATAVAEQDTVVTASNSSQTASVTATIPAAATQVAANDKVTLEISELSNSTSTSTNTLSVRFDATLKVNDTVVSNFSEPVKIELNVGTGKEIAKITHHTTSGDVEVTDYEYDSLTGKVTFYSQSFSPFTVEFYDLTEELLEYPVRVGKVGFETLSAALAYIPSDGKEYTITVQQDLENQALRVFDEKKVQLDLCDYSLSFTSAFATNPAIYASSNTEVTVKNGSISNAAGIAVFRADSGLLLIDNIDYSSSNGSAVYNFGETTIKNSSFEFSKVGTQIMNGHNSIGPGELLVLNTDITGDYPVASGTSAIISNNKGSIELKESNINISHDSVAQGYSAYNANTVENKGTAVIDNTVIISDASHTVSNASAATLMTIKGDDTYIECLTDKKNAVDNFSVLVINGGTFVAGPNSSTGTGNGAISHHSATNQTTINGGLFLAGESAHNQSDAVTLTTGLWIINGGTYNQNIQADGYYDPNKVTWNGFVVDNGDGTWSVVAPVTVNVSNTEQLQNALNTLQAENNTPVKVKLAAGNYGDVILQARPDLGNTVTQEDAAHNTALSNTYTFDYNYRTLSNIIIEGGEGVNVDSIRVMSGRCGVTRGYNYVPQDPNNGEDYSFDGLAVDGLTVKNINFTGAGVYVSRGYNTYDWAEMIAGTQSLGEIKNITVDSCSFNPAWDNGAIPEGKWYRDHMYGGVHVQTNHWDNGSGEEYIYTKNVTIKNCQFTNILGVAGNVQDTTAINLQDVEGDIKILNNTFTNTYFNHIQMNSGFKHAGTITITGNDFGDNHDRMLRFNSDYSGLTAFNLSGNIFRNTSTGESSGPYGKSSVSNLNTQIFADGKLPIGANSWADTSITEWTTTAVLYGFSIINAEQSYVAQ